jgi:hypothetical protein
MRGDFRAARVARGLFDPHDVGEPELFDAPARG